MVKTSLVLAAGGSGLRMGGSAGSAPPKQLRELTGRLVLLRAIDPFIDLVSEVVVAAPAAYQQQIEQALRTAFSHTPIQVVLGGATRQQSVLAAVRAARGEIVLVHDAARPCTPRSCIVACLEALNHHQAALVALPCRDTVKRADAGATVVASTLPREQIHLAQTPQGFHREPGLAALEAAERAGVSCTDESEACERAGITVALVPGSPRNLKLTTADDWVVAEAVLRLAR